MATKTLVSSCRKWSVIKLINNFRQGCSLVEVQIPEIGPDEIIVKNRFVGINASDINVPAGRYSTDGKLPFDIGFEGVGQVVKVGSNVSTVKPGQSVGHMSLGAFSEYQVMPANVALNLPDCQAEHIPLLISGLGTSIGLDVHGDIKPGKSVLITAAAGGAGQMAVQYAKSKDCHVIGTCSSDHKTNILKKLGCDRVINYKKEDVNTALSTDYKDGIDVVFEGVGGSMLVHAVDNIARHGRIIQFGVISAYHKSDMSMDVFPNLATLILRSASIRGHFFADHAALFPQYLEKLLKLKDQGKLLSQVDNGSTTSEGPFQGLEDIPRAIDHMYSSGSCGKVVVDLEKDGTSTDNKT